MVHEVPPILRSVIAVSAGLFLGGVAIFGIESMGHVLIPPPAGLDVSDPAATRSAMEGMSPAARRAMLLPVLLAYAIGPMIGAWFAARMAPARALVHAGVVGAFFFVGGVMNFMTTPHPTWFVAASLALFAAAPYLGTKLAGR